MPTKEETVVIGFAALSALALYVLSHEEDTQPREEPDSEHTIIMVNGNPKEVNFLRFNQDGIYSNLLATEEHFRNLQSKGGNKDFNQCAVKHLSMGGNHSDEAVSHTIAIGDKADSVKYARLRDDIISLQHDVQDGKVTPTEGIKRVREIRHEFEAFNPTFDVSKCKACEVT